MISPIRNRRPPYSLAADVVYFHDWRYVQHGEVGWRHPEGREVPMWSTRPVPPLRYEPRFLPTGIRLRAKQAAKSEAFLSSAMFDGLFVTGGTAIRDGGRYRFWFDAVPAEHIGSTTYSMGLANYVGYAESDDGVSFRMPTLRLIERKGSRDNNLVYGLPIAGETGYHGGSVFLDPSAPAAERYKMFYQGWMQGALLDRYLAARPEEVDAFEKGEAKQAVLLGAVSPDGLSWKPLPDPLVAQVSDTQNVCEYDPVLKSYVAYCRSWLFYRRTIGRIIAPTFRRFSLSEDVVWPAPDFEPYELWYANAKTRIPGTLDYHVMFPMRWSIRNDTFDFFLMASPDNLLWNFVPGGPVCAPGEPGAWDGGVVQPCLGMVELPGERWAIPIGCTPVPHKHPRVLPFGSIAWASWPKGRLVALEAPVEGAFALWPLQVAKRRLVLNTKTAPAGSVQVQVLGSDRKPLAGRSFADCDWLIGDHLAKEMTWSGKSDLGHRDGEPITLCFRLRCAELYSVEFR